VHCAGYAHADLPASEDNDAAHVRVNRDLALDVASAAAVAGVRRFVFVSTVKAVGQPGQHCVDETYGTPAETAYGRAKREAEDALLAAGATQRMQIVILRPVMVYGPGSRGNLERMMRLVRRGLFPPLPETGNRRSVVHVRDLVDAISLAATHPAAAGRTYNVAHPHAYSGRQLYLAMCACCSIKPAKWSVPEVLMRAAGRGVDILNRAAGLRLPMSRHAVSSLLDSACYSTAAIEHELGWRPEIDLEEGLASLLAEVKVGPTSHEARD
jgi:nucleoside-diphosphate-sugar epimerase